jgi:hypothetical protein
MRSWRISSTRIWQKPPSSIRGLGLLFMVCHSLVLSLSVLNMLKKSLTRSRRENMCETMTKSGNGPGPDSRLDKVRR